MNENETVCQECGMDMVKDEAGNFYCPTCGVDDEDRDESMEPNDDMDGDFDSAMASAGLGTDEDYGYYGGYED